MNFKPSISHYVLSKEEYWDNRVKEFKRTKKSQRQFRSYPLQEDVVRVVKDALSTMYDRAEEWIPDGFSLSEDGSAIRIEFNIINTDIERSHQEHEEISSLRLEEIRVNISKDIEDLK